jgi:hypothetical protein
MLTARSHRSESDNPFPPSACTAKFSTASS